jgi:LuxR family maltose regulon positive regulatory protein
MPHYPHLNDIYMTTRISQQLANLEHLPIITVIAPMGYGKTTLIDWWTKRQLKADTDAVMLKQLIVTDSVTDFWAGFCRAFRNYPELVEQLKALGYPEDARSMAMLVELLEDALADSDKRIYLILDDVYIFHQKQLAPLIIFLSRRLSDYLQIILISRNQIFGEEERMSLGNKLGEITAEDLRLTEHEIVDYAKFCGLSVSEEAAKALATSSEGWISMVYLNFKAYVQNGKWLSGSDDLFTLMDQVLLVPLTERQREFLILNGMADEFTIAQATYLWGQQDTVKLLNTLSQNNAFITRHDNGLYRYHYMLRQCVRQKFSEKPEAYQNENFSRLGNWYLSIKEYVAADEAFAKAADWDGLLTSLGEDRAKSLNAEHRSAFFEWMKQCPEAMLLKYPDTIVACMVKMFSFNNMPEIFVLKKLLLKALAQNDDLTQQERNNLLGDAEVSESFLCYNNISAMSAHHRRAGELLNRASKSIDPKGAWTFSAPSVLMMFHREVGGADSENAEMIDCMPYFYKVTNGHGSGAEHAFLADLSYERGCFTDADIANRKAFMDASRNKQFSIMLTCQFLDMRRALLRGNYEEIQRLIVESHDWLRRERQYMLLSTLDMCQGFIFALLGHPEKAPAWFAKGRLNEALVMSPATPMLNSFYNQLLLSQKQWTAVIARRDHCEKLNGAYHAVMCQIWLYIQLAVAFEHLQKPKEAMAALHKALEMALPDEIFMPFAENSELIMPLLTKLKESHVDAENTEFMRKITVILELSQCFQKGKVKILQKHWLEANDFGLTDRELEIAKLAAARKTNLEIAETLHLSEGTIKNQLKRIFDKLEIKGNGRNKRLELEKIVFPASIE